MSALVLRRAACGVAALAALLLPVTAASAQNAGAPRPGLRLSFQPAFTFSQFTGEESEQASYSRRRGNSLAIRGSYLLFGAVSGYVEVGPSGRGSIVRVPEESTVLDVRADWWDLGGGVNVALRCIGQVCPSLDLGGVFARSREAIIRDDATGRPLGTLPIARYEHSLSAGVRLVVPKLRGIALVLRHQEGLSNLARDEREAFRSRSQLLQVALPLIRD
jgi:hypothetical protein